MSIASFRWLWRGSCKLNSSAPPSGDISDILSKLETNQQAALSTFSELNQLYKRMWANVAQLEASDS